jgi:hypothetical protein
MFRILAVAILCMTTSAAAEPYIAHATLPYKGPVAYVDKNLQVVFYAETDGRHLSAINLDGRVLWTRSPFVDAQLKPYRVVEPRIVKINPPLPWMIVGAKGTFVAITFESTQFGLVDVKSGDFILLGQD